RHHPLHVHGHPFLRRARHLLPRRARHQPALGRLRDAPLPHLQPRTSSRRRAMNPTPSDRPGGVVGALKGLTEGQRWTVGLLVIVTLLFLSFGLRRGQITGMPFAAGTLPTPAGATTPTAPPARDLDLPSAT